MSLLTRPAPVAPLAEARRPGDPRPFPVHSAEWEQFHNVLAHLNGGLVRRYDAKPNPRRGVWCENPAPGLCSSGERWLARCKQYKCLFCGTRSAGEWEETIEGIVKLWQAKGLNIYMATHTVAGPEPGSPWKFDDKQAHQRVTRVWGIMRKRLARQTGADVHYVLAIERQQNGNIHWHTLIGTAARLRSCSPQSRGGKNRWRKKRGEPLLEAGEHWCDPADPCYKQVATDAGLGFTDLRPVTSAKAGASYLVKYVRKGVGEHFPRYARRIRCSRLEVGGQRPPSVTQTREQHTADYLATLPKRRHQHDEDCQPRRAPLDRGWWETTGELVYLVAADRWTRQQMLEEVAPAVASRPPPGPDGAPRAPPPTPPPRLPLDY